VANETVSGSLSTYQFLMTKAILEQRVTNGTRSPEHDCSGEEDFETVHKEAIDRKLEAQENEIDD